ncbi:rop guanine nucleotide exchange factor 9 isoform X2 [Oryza brachyantha]|uniref:rop guanine nucleotide exchange factor 9 isoform X2 n=1 Tax=Oryza brachyantha TaxID=4533 RepID=UPI001ADC249D|nr:rop guanine nucleotide exchange factor 9 isoform X2 [Oryza brachyantha]
MLPSSPGASSYRGQCGRSIEPPPGSWITETHKNHQLGINHFNPPFLFLLVALCVRSAGRNLGSSLCFCTRRSRPQKAASFTANGGGALLERRSSVQRSQSMVLEEDRGPPADGEQLTSSGGGGGGALKIGAVLDRDSTEAPKSRLAKDAGDHGGGGGGPSEMELMKEKFAKLLLGEDMSGSGKGVPSALAVSNAITNLAASVFGEQRKLEPMAPDRKGRWKKEVGWLLSVADHIVEFVAKKQVLDNGTEMEVMGTQQRRDLQANIPALRKIDTMLLDYLDNYKDRNEFWYVKRDSCSESDKEETQRSEEKWWIPIVKVPAGGLSPASRGWLQHQKELVNQLLKAAMAINANCLMEMAIPESYLEALPKNGRASLGDALYRIITDVEFDPDVFLSTVDLTSEHKILDLKDRIEASVIIWNRKVHNKDGKSAWGSAVSQEKREQFEERAQTLLLIIKHRYPGIPQSTLDIAKIQENRDVGFAILESYSRVLESLAFNVMSRIEDVLSADDLARERAKREAAASPAPVPAPALAPAMANDAAERHQQVGEADGPGKMAGSPNGRTLLDFMDDWNGDAERPSPTAPEAPAQEDGRLMKLPNIMTNLKQTYMDKLDLFGAHRSPPGRH